VIYDQQISLSRLFPGQGKVRESNIPSHKKNI
jgi:hypothetical protein